MGFFWCSQRIDVKVKSKIVADDILFFFFFFFFVLFFSEKTKLGSLCESFA